MCNADHARSRRLPARIAETTGQPERALDAVKVAIGPPGSERYLCPQ
jgi:hypothetical protein